MKSKQQIGREYRIKKLKFLACVGYATTRQISMAVLGACDVSSRKMAAARLVAPSTPSGAGRRRIQLLRSRRALAAIDPAACSGPDGAGKGITDDGVLRVSDHPLVLCLSGPGRGQGGGRDCGGSSGARQCRDEPCGGQAEVTAGDLALFLAGCDAWAARRGRRAVMFCVFYNFRLLPRQTAACPVSVSKRCKTPFSAI